MHSHECDIIAQITHYLELPHTQIHFQKRNTSRRISQQTQHSFRLLSIRRRNHKTLTRTRNGTVVVGSSDGHLLFLFLPLHHLQLDEFDAALLQTLVLRMGKLAQRRLAVIDAVRQRARNERVPQHDQRQHLRLTSSANTHIEGTAVVERERQSVLQRPREDVGRHGRSLLVIISLHSDNETTKRGHDLSQSIHLGSEVLVRAVGDEHHAVGAPLSNSSSRTKGYVTNMNRKHCVTP